MQHNFDKETMIQLPEIETIRRDLERDCVGKKIKTIEVTKAKIQTTRQDIPLEVNYIEEDEKIVFESQETLSEGVYELYLEFNSEITNDLKGFYKSSYMSEDGEKKMDCYHTI